jgi:tetratricopeptide (TPR) repeat protein
MDCLERGYFAGSFGACLEDLEKAVTIDPGFALAYLQLAVLRFLEGEPLALQQAALRKAQANAARVPPHDRRRLEGQVALLEGREVEAKALFRASAEASPDDKFAWWLAAEIPFHRDEYGEALPLFRRIHTLAPTWLDATQHLTFALGVTGDLDGVRALASELDAAGQGAKGLAAACYARLWFDPDSAVATCQRAKHLDAGETTDGFLAIALLNVDHRDQLRAHLDTMERARKGAPRGFAWYMRLWLLARAGRWPEVEQVAAKEHDPADAWFHSTLVEIIAGSGDAGRVRREALRILELNRSLASNLAVHLAYLGDLRSASEFERYLPPDSPRVEAYRALVQWRSGDLAGAIERLQRVAAKAPAGSTPEIPASLFLLGEALSEAGRDAEAADTLRRYQRIPVLYPTWIRPLSSFFLARSLERLGDRDAARRALSPLLTLWATASETQPHLAEARALGKRLGLE